MSFALSVMIPSSDRGIGNAGAEGLADRLIERLDAAVRRIDFPSRTVLAKAFQGELVPTGAGLS